MGFELYVIMVFIDLRVIDKNRRNQLTCILCYRNDVVGCVPVDCYLLRLGVKIGPWNDCAEGKGGFYLIGKNRAYNAENLAIHFLVTCRYLEFIA